jgi:hypothetical protein
MKQLLLCITLMLASAATLFAQSEHPNAFRRAEINWNAISLARIEGLNGWGGQLGVAINIVPAIAIVGDFDAHRNNELGATLDLYTYRAGPRFYSHHGDRVRTFGHVLVGGAQLKESAVISGLTTSLSVNGFALAVGGGVDVGIKPWFAIRAGQFDYDYTRFQGMTLDGFRVGGGVVFRMGKSN